MSLLKRLFICFLLLSLSLAWGIGPACLGEEKKFVISESQRDAWINELRLSRENLAKSKEEIQQSNQSLQEALITLQKQKDELEQEKKEKKELLSTITNWKQSWQEVNNLTNQQAEAYKTLILEFEAWKTNYGDLMKSVEDKIKSLERQIRKEKIIGWFKGLAGLALGYLAGKS